MADIERFRKRLESSERYLRSKNAVGEILKEQNLLMILQTEILLEILEGQQPQSEGKTDE